MIIKLTENVGMRGLWVFSVRIDLLEFKELLMIVLILKDEV